MTRSRFDSTANDRKGVLCDRLTGSDIIRSVKEGDGRERAIVGGFSALFVVVFIIALRVVRIVRKRQRAAVGAAGRDTNERALGALAAPDEDFGEDQRDEARPRHGLVRNIGWYRGGCLGPSPPPQRKSAAARSNAAVMGCLS